MKTPTNPKLRTLASVFGAMSVIAMTQAQAHAGGAAVARWNLGEQDSGAAAGNLGNATTTDAITTPGNDLVQTGSPTYDANVPAGGSSLSVGFTGGSYYRSDAVQALTSNFDYDNFGLSFDCYPTGNPGYNTPVSMGLYGQRSSFFFFESGTWRYNMNGGGAVTLGAGTLNAWTHCEFRRVMGTNYWYLNGTQVGPVGNTTVPGGTFAPVVCIGGIAKGANGAFDAPGGDWQGYVDNVVITNLNLGNPPVISGFAASPTKIYAGNSIILNAAVSGDTAGRGYILRTNGVTLATPSSLPYFINGATTNYNGNYDLIVTNNYGAATSSIVVVSVLPSGGADVLKLRMGDNDPGAVAGNTGNAQTIEAILGNNFDLSGNPVYSNNVPAGGGSLSVAFDGGSYYRNTTLTNFLAGLDQNNYSLSFDINPTALGGNGFSFPLTIGRNGGGMGLVEIGGSWQFYRMGVGGVLLTDQIPLNQWTHFEIQRRDFDGTVRIRCFVNGKDQNFQSTTYSVAGPILTVGGNTVGDGVGTEGLFTGMIDNLVIHNYSIGALPAIISGPTSTPGNTVAINQALTLSVTMSGGTPATYFWKRNGTTVVTEVTNNTSTVTFPAPVIAGAYSVVVSNSPAGVVTSPNLVITVDPRSDNPNVVTFKLGENDPGAANGSVGNPLTLQFEGLKDLIKYGNPTYTNLVAPGGSTLAMYFGGNFDYYGVTNSNSGQWSYFYSTSFDTNSFSMECDAYPTGDGVQGFSVAISMGQQGNNYFIYHAGGNWFVHKNGSGNIISGPAVNLNQWQHLKLVRRDFGSGPETHLFINGADVGSTFVPLSPTPAFTIGANPRSDYSVEGPFLGAIDNVKIISPVPGAVPILAVSLSGGSALVNLTGGEPNTTYRLERTTSLDPASWTTVDTQTTDISGAVRLTDAAPPAVQSFYRTVTP